MGCGQPPKTTLLRRKEIVRLPGLDRTFIARKPYYYYKLDSLHIIVFKRGIIDRCRVNDCSFILSVATLTLLAPARREAREMLARMLKSRETQVTLVRSLPLCSDRVVARMTAFPCILANLRTTTQNSPFFA